MIIGAIVMIGLLVIAIGGAIRRELIELEGRRSVRSQVRDREALQRPAAGTVVVEGRIVSPPEPLRVVVRRQFGCLGGPIVHIVPTFELEREDGSRQRVDVGPDPVVENLELLTRDVTWQPALAPMHTGAPDSVLLLGGRVRVAGVLPPRKGALAPPTDHSAVLTFLES